MNYMAKCTVTHKMNENASKVLEFRVLSEYLGVTEVLSLLVDLQFQFFIVFKSNNWTQKIIYETLYHKTVVTLVFILIIVTYRFCDSPPSAHD